VSKDAGPYQNQRTEGQKAGEVWAKMRDRYLTAESASKQLDLIEELCSRYATVAGASLEDVPPIEWIAAAMEKGASKGGLFDSYVINTVFAIDSVASTEFYRAAWESYTTDRYSITDLRFAELSYLIGCPPLQKCDCEGVTFNQCNLRDVPLTDANLDIADLRTAYWFVLDGNSIQGTKFILPSKYGKPSSRLMKEFIAF
jgi:hypothetical protein